MSKESVYGEADRPRGILTESDREYLLARGEAYSRQAAHARKRAISKRFVHGILDLALLADLPADERQELFIAKDDEGFQGADPLQETRAALAFLYSHVENDLEGDFEKLLADAIVQAETEDDSTKMVFRTAEVSISEPDSFDTKQILEVVKDPSMLNELSRQELFFMILMAHGHDADGHETGFQWLLEELAETLYEHWLDLDFIDPYTGRQRSDE